MSKVEAYGVWRQKLIRFFWIMPVLLFSACGDSLPSAHEISAEEKINALISAMSLEQKTGQMFFQAFRGEAHGGINEIKKYHIGGVVLFAENIQSAGQVTDYINDLQNAANLPLFIGIDEEGGRVLRTGALDVPRLPAAFTLESTGDAYNAAKTIAGYLSPLGFNVNFAPVADVLTNPANTVIGDRAFADTADKAAGMVASFTRGLLDNAMLPTLKHFPGHGDTNEDSHYGAAATYKTLAQLYECEFIPFMAGIEAGAPFVMAGHISTPNIDANIDNNNEPALFSAYLLQDVLRSSLGFDGIIISDALNMEVITRYYSSKETAVKAVSAGVDMLLMPENLEEAYAGIIEAVKSGAISEARIDESVRRILTAKYKSGWEPVQ